MVMRVFTYYFENQYNSKISNSIFAFTRCKNREKWEDCRISEDVAFWLE